MEEQGNNGAFSYLSRGANVEVLSKQKGSKGAWFPAIVLEPPANPSASKRKTFTSNKALIQYTTLVSDQDPTKPLFEHTSVSLLRPAPPADNADERFEENDVVDVFDLDGWWTGVVMSVVGEKYTVGFKNPPDLLKVERGGLRAHWVWEHGVWTRAPKEVMRGSDYLPGTAVEVNLEKSHLWFAWLPAIYLGQVGSDSFLVQYRYETQENVNVNGLVKVVVADHQIRPRPPQQEKKDFHLLQMVDAFFDKGWWVGDITKVLGNEKYVVTFKFTKEVKEFCHLYLRCHQEWIDKKWVTDLSEFKSPKGYGGQPRQPRGSSSTSVVKTPCRPKLPRRKTTDKLKRSQHPSDDSTFLSPTPCKKLKGEDSENMSSLAQSNRRKTPARKGLFSDEEPNEQQQIGQLDSVAITVAKRGSQPNSKFLKQGAKRIPQNASEPEAIGGLHAGNSCVLPVKETEHDNEAGVSSGIIGKEKQAELLVQHSKDPAAGWMNDAVEKPASRRCDENLATYKRKNRFELTGVNQNGTGAVTDVEVSKTNGFEHIGSEDLTAGGGNAEASAIRFPEEGEEISVEMATQDQPLSIFIDEMDSENTIQGLGYSAGTANELNMAAVTEMFAKTPAHDQPVPLCIYKMHYVKTMEGLSSEDATDGKAEATPMEIEVTGAGIPTKTALHDHPLILSDMDSENTVEGSSNPAGIAKTPLHDQVQASSTDEMHSGHIMKLSCNRTGTGKQHYQVTGRQGETGFTSGIEREETPHLPFVKKSPFWKMLESMDTFKRFPQQPHFKPLLKVKMLCREGLALAGMHIFATVVKYISKLQVDDPSNSITEVLEVLDELQWLGFDVKALCDRLNEMKDLQLKYAELKEKTDRVKILIRNCKHDRTKGSEVISGMDVEINDLEEKIRGIQAMRANAVSEWAATTSEISKLESEASAISEGIQSIEHDFQALAAAAW